MSNVKMTARELCIKFNAENKNIYFPPNFNVRFESRKIPAMHEFCNPKKPLLSNEISLTNDVYKILSINDIYGYGAIRLDLLDCITNNGLSIYYDPKGTLELLSKESYINFIKENEKSLFMICNSRDMTHNFMIGSDPEIFVEDDKGECIPAYNFLNSKENPDLVYRLGNAQGTTHAYWDGFQAEFTTNAEKCMEYHSDSIASGLQTVLNSAKQKFPNAKLSIKSVFDIPFETLQSAEEKYVAFGCMPSMNAYNLNVQMPFCRDVPFRSAGGHIHFGVGQTTVDNALPIVMALDAILGVACVSLFANFDDPKRRVLYGLPGEFRLPPHGIEYRPLSNAWMVHPFITNLVFDVARKCVVLGKNNYFHALWKSTPKETINCIIKCDVAKSKRILNRNKAMFLHILQSAYPSFSIPALECLYDIFINGMDSVIEDPTDFESNWGFNKKDPWKGRCAGRNVVALLPQILSGKKIKHSSFFSK